MLWPTMLTVMIIPLMSGGSAIVATDDLEGGLIIEV